MRIILQTRPGIRNEFTQDTVYISVETRSCFAVLEKDSVLILTGLEIGTQVYIKKTRIK